MENKQEVPEGYMRNSRGGLDPIDMVKEIDKLRDQMVKEIVVESMAESKRLQSMKQKFFETISSFVDLSAEQYGIQYGGKKGNMSFLMMESTKSLCLLMKTWFLTNVCKLQNSL